MLSGFTSPEVTGRGLGPRLSFAGPRSIEEAAVSVEQRVRDIVAPLLGDSGPELFDVEYAGGILRVMIDRPGGLDIADISSVTRELSALLDEHDVIPGRYTLEVSSPGLERPLRTPEHFIGAIGSKVNLKTVAGVPGDRRVVGTITAADADGVTIQPQEAEPGAVRRLAHDEIERTRTVFEWGPAPKPGTPGASKPTKKKAATP
jgi:ribosome maturation factor RimP